jgi:integral membrane protein (TIGR01906 family)
MSALLQKTLKVFLFIAFTLGIISLAAKFTLNFKPLYYFDINYLNIEETNNMSKEDIKSNYSYLIEYIENDENIEFKLPTLPSSETGVIHFKEVKDIFQTLDKIIISSLVVIFLGLLVNLKNISVLKHVSTFLISIPVILSIGFAISFNYSFTLFHKIFFRNDYWVFSPDEDPIINLLPQEFFMHSAILILFLILFIGIVLKFIFRKPKDISSRYISLN